MQKHLPFAIAELVLAPEAQRQRSLHPGAWYLSRSRADFVGALVGRCRRIAGAAAAERVRECLHTASDRAAAGQSHAPSASVNGPDPERPASLSSRRRHPPSSASRQIPTAERERSFAPRRRPSRPATGEATAPRRSAEESAPDGPQSVRIAREEDIHLARTAVLQAARQWGASPSARTRAATVVSELARNIVHYAGTGVLRYQIEGGEIALEAEDQGPGIDADRLAEIMSGRYRSKSGLGLGLLGTQRLAKQFEVDSALGRGTRVRARLTLR